MSMMSIEEVANYLGVQPIRVEREHLLIAKSKSEDGKPLFEEDDVARYKQLAERLGGI